LENLRAYLRFSAFVIRIGWKIVGIDFDKEQITILKNGQKYTLEKIKCPMYMYLATSLKLWSSKQQTIVIYALAV
jgi:UDP-N-acetyl-D-mannosaminuronate dehydrogenase